MFAEAAKGVRLASITTITSARASRGVSFIFVASFLKFKSQRRATAPPSAPASEAATDCASVMKGCG